MASIEDVGQAIKQCVSLCRSINNRAGDGSTPSRVTLQYQIVQLIGHLFINTLPIPREAHVPGAPAHPDCVYRNAVTRTLQMQVLEGITELVMVYGLAWQVRTGDSVK